MISSVLIICIVLPFVNQVKQKLSAMKEELDNIDGVSRQIHFQYINISFLIHLSHNFFFDLVNNYHIEREICQRERRSSEILPSCMVSPP